MSSRFHFRLTPLALLVLLAVFAVWFPASVHAEQDNLESPSIGHLRDAKGTWHVIYGIPGNFVLGPETEAPAETQPAAEPIEQFEQRGEVWFVVTEDGAVVDALPVDARAPMALLAEGVLFATGEQLVLRPRGGSRNEVRLECSGITGLRAMSAQWVQVSAEGREYALRLEPGREALFLLPALVPETTAEKVRRR